MGLLAIYCRTSVEHEESIEQQREAGIEFASENGLDFEVYEDEGKSGYKLPDDYDDDLYKNRPAFSRLMNQDIKSGKITAVWVWEQSRLARKEWVSGKIWYDFERYGIQVYVRDRLYDYKNIQNKAMRGMFGVWAELEREQIVERTTRGTRAKIDKGERSYCSLYGYKKVAKDVRGLLIWEPVESEVANIKYAYKRISEGATLRQLATEIYKNQNMTDKKNKLYYAQKWKMILIRFVYTGYTLNMAGIQIYNDFWDNKIDSLAQLNDPKFYVKSKNYPVKIIPVQEWIKTVEALQLWNRRLAERTKTNRASKDLATGIMACGKCGAKYYTFATQIKKPSGKVYDVRYYKHFVKFIGDDCGQKKSFSVKRIDGVFEIFYLLNYAVYDNTKETLADTLRQLKQDQLESRERIKAVEKEIKQSEKNITKFQKALGENEDIDIITVLAKRISTEEEKLKSLNIEKTDKVIGLEKLKINTDRTEAENAYYNVKDKIDGFFDAVSIERKRNALIQAIKKCVVIDEFILIDTDYNLFVFDTKIPFVLDKKILEAFRNDEHFKENYLNPLLDSDNKFTPEIQEFMNTPTDDADKYSDIDLLDIENRIISHLIVRHFGSFKAKEYRMNDEKQKAVIEGYFGENNLDYDISHLRHVILFNEVVSKDTNFDKVNQGLQKLKKMRK